MKNINNIKINHLCCYNTGCAISQYKDKEIDQVKLKELKNNFHITLN